MCKRSLTLHIFQFQGSLIVKVDRSSSFTLELKDRCFRDNRSAQVFTNASSNAALDSTDRTDFNPGSGYWSGGKSNEENGDMKIKQEQEMDEVDYDTDSYDHGYSQDHIGLEEVDSSCANETINAVDNPAGHLYACIMCACKYFTKNELADHLLVHCEKQETTNCAQFNKPYDKFEGVSVDIARTIKYSSVHRFFCSTCDQGCATRTHLKRHQQVHANSRQYSCSHCSKKFNNRYALKIHRHTHRQTKVKPLDDDNRQKPANTVLSGVTSDLQIDAIDSKPDLAYVCAHCPNRYMDREKLLNHLVVHDQIYPCAYCSRTLRSKLDLRRHTWTHTGQHAFRCSTCNQGCYTAFKLRLHERVHTNERPFECTQCEYKFKRRDHLKKHVLAVHKDNAIMCSRCAKQFDTSDELKAHLCDMKKEEKPKKKKRNSPQPFICPICGKTLSTSIRAQHLRDHSDIRPFSCVECEKSFKRSTHLSTHLALVHKLNVADDKHKLKGDKLRVGSGDFVCSICAKRCHNASKLLSHERTHTKQSAFSCTECEQIFNCTERLNVHLVDVHHLEVTAEDTEEKAAKVRRKGSRVYVCSTCGQQCDSPAHLKRHQVIHTNERPFACTECDKTFRRSDNLTAHLAALHGTRVDKSRYSCTICQEKFNFRSSFEEHLTTHTDRGRGLE